MSVATLEWRFRLLNQWYDRAIASLPNLILIAIILVVTMILSRRTQGFVRNFSERTQAPPEVIDLAGRAARFAVVALGTLLVLDRLNLSGAVLSFIAGLGIFGIIIGFALQDIVKQFAAGVLLLMLRPFRIGDEVKIGAFEGRVIQVQLRATVLKTDGGNEVLIPNAEVYSTAIINRSRYSLHRHAITLSVPPAADLARTRAALAQALAGVPGVSPNPAPAIVATGMADNAVQLEARFWIDEHAQSAEAVSTGAIAALRRGLEQAQAQPEQAQANGESGG
jgi:small conductance mechanosensitive channel